MNLSLKQRLERSQASGSASSRAIASYMLANRNELAFSNAQEIAHKVGVSESTVGRFCRGLGYPHLKALKEDLRDDLGDSPWLIGDRLQAFRGSAAGAVQGSGLEREIAALVRVHEHQQSPHWQALCQRLAQSPRVFAAGFQTERGIAMSFVHLLQYLRDGVQLVDGAAGHYAEVLLSPPADTCLVVFEARRYSQHALQLCQKAQASGIAVTLITDDYCDWAEQHADVVLRVPTDFNLFWQSTAAMLSLVHLLINDVFRLLGPQVDARLESVARLHNTFVGYTSSLKHNN
jgi:DNA-binding MurR/RpiR family transcriptional regulator